MEINAWVCVNARAYVLRICARADTRCRGPTVVPACMSEFICVHNTSHVIFFFVLRNLSLHVFLVSNNMHIICVNSHPRYATVDEWLSS